MMRGKSQTPEHVLYIYTETKSFVFKEDLARETILFLQKYYFVLFLHVYYIFFLIRQKLLSEIFLFFNSKDGTIK